MWLKLILATFYLLVVFLLSRLVDVVINSYDLQPFGIFPSYLVVDPVVLSVKQLKHVLDQRGISYAGLWEKRELQALIETSGDLSREELRDFETESEEIEEKVHDKEVTKFTCGEHFYELVEDTKDSAWVILVKPHSGGSSNKYSSSLPSEPPNWRKLSTKAAKFGIRTGVFDCSLDRLLCDSKHWSSARILLSMPRDSFKAKDDVVFRQYLIGDNLQPLAVFKWIHEQLATRVKQVASEEEVDENWLALNQSSFASNVQQTDDDRKMKLLLVSSLATPPLILSALAMKFNGRIKFGMFRTTSELKGKQHGHAMKRLPAYVITLSDQSSVYVYGNKAGEVVSYKNLELFFRTLQPEMDDVFLLSLFLVNIVVCLQFFWMKCSRLWKHLIFWFSHFIKTNAILFLFWLAVLTFSGFPLVERAIDLGLRAYQYGVTSWPSMAMIVRHDALYHYKSPVLATAFVFCAAFLFVYRRMCHISDFDNDDEFLFRDWAPWESTILSYILFRGDSMAISLRPVSTSIEANLEEGMELLIERLAVPNLWLHSELISNEYIKDLPVWHFKGNLGAGSSTSEDSEDAEASHSEYETSDNTTSAFGASEEIALSPSLAPLVSAAQQPEELLHSSSSQSVGNSVSGGSNSQEGSEPSRTSEQQLCSSSPSPQLKKRSSRESPRSELGKTKENSSKLKHQKAQRDFSPEATAPDGVSFFPSKECAICLDSYRKNQLICGLPCGHNYHENCIMAWLYRDNHCCPQCRWATYLVKPKIC